MSDLHVVYRQVQSCFRANLGKMLVSLFVMLICISVFSSILFSPLILTDSASAGVWLLPLFVLEICLSGIFTYGLYVMLKRFYLKERAILGNLFAGFRIWPQVAGATVTMYLTVFAWLLVLSVPFSLLLMRWPELLFVQSGESMILNMDLAVVVSVILVAVAYILMSLRYAFVYLYMQTHQDVSVFEILRCSARMLAGYRFKLLLFCFKCGGMWLLLGLLFGSGLFFFSFYTTVLSDGAETSVIVSLRYIVSSCTYICMYVVLIKIMLAVIGFYCWLSDEQKGMRQDIKEEKLLLEE